LHAVENEVEHELEVVMSPIVVGVVRRWATSMTASRRQ
jgi:hypothetical protein